MPWNVFLFKWRLGITFLLSLESFLGIAFSFILFSFTNLTDSIFIGMDQTSFRTLTYPSRFPSSRFYRDFLGATVLKKVNFFCSEYWKIKPASIHKTTVQRFKTKARFSLEIKVQDYRSKLYALALSSRGDI